MKTPFCFRKLPGVLHLKLFLINFVSFIALNNILATLQFSPGDSPERGEANGVHLSVMVMLLKNRCEREDKLLSSRLAQDAVRLIVIILGF